MKRGCIDVAVLRGRPLTHVRSLSMQNLNPSIRAFPFFFSSRKLAERVHKGKKVRLFKDRHTQSTKGASIARKCTRLGRRVLRHQPAQSLRLLLHYDLFFMRRDGLSILKVCSYIFYLYIKMGLRKSRYLKFRRATPQCVVLHTLVLMYS